MKEQRLRGDAIFAAMSNAGSSTLLILMVSPAIHAVVKGAAIRATCLAPASEPGASEVHS